TGRATEGLSQVGTVAMTYAPAAAGCSHAAGESPEFQFERRCRSRCTGSGQYAPTPLLRAGRLPVQASPDGPGDPRPSAVRLPHAEPSGPSASTAVPPIDARHEGRPGGRILNRCFR